MDLEVRNVLLSRDDERELATSRLRHFGRRSFLGGRSSFLGSVSPSLWGDNRGLALRLKRLYT